LNARANIIRIAKTLLLTAALLCMFVPWLQDLTRFKTYVDPLSGAFTPEKDHAFNWRDWFSRDYQDQKEKFLKDNFGLHNYYIRLQAQLRYNLFNKASAAYVVVGKNNYLFETGYFDAYYGRDFIGRKKIEAFTRQLRCVQDTLEKQGKMLLVVLAPGKASFYPEYIPSEYRSAPALSNYIYFRHVFRRSNLNHIDFNKYFIEQKYKSPYPLYPQFGIHWSNYGSIMAFDSIVKYAEHKLRTDLPDLDIGPLTMSDSLRHTDNDVIKGMNLIREPKSFAMAYPEFKVVYDSARHRKPRLLVVGDSFWWYMYSTKMPETVFSDLEFWFYNEAVYPASFNAQLNVKEINYFEKIRRADVILIMHSESTLARFGDGFVEMSYRTLCDPEVKDEKLQNMKAIIRATPEWYAEIVRKAAARKLSVDSMLTLDARYMLDKE
jgi:hypothetical protein